MVILIHEAEEPPAQRSPPPIAELPCPLAIDNDLAFIRVFKKAGDMEQRRLAAARLANQSDYLPRSQVERDATQHLKTAIALDKGALDPTQ